MQNKTHSLIESILNVTVGYLVAVTSQIIIFPYFGIDIPMADNFIIGLWFTVISIARSYTIRRLFTKYINKWIDRLIRKINKLHERIKKPNSI